MIILLEYLKLLLEELSPIILLALSLTILGVFLNYKARKENMESKNFSEQVKTNKIWIENMISKHQLTTSVRKKSYEKLIKEKNLATRLELLGPMLFYIQYEKRNRRKYLVYFLRWVNFGKGIFNGFGLSMFVVFLILFTLLFITGVLFSTLATSQPNVFLFPILSSVSGLYFF